ncbi:hypothetical protein EVAR_34391_1 [Eumeta japonica]|uniref:Uncharacterized protein n=1 Tax=Eumeta variegata TaxID=151549 RepID=A0A4C1WZM5_EUMVA|nr:hypothetical protein EVAR_34391_1 [Eumeta japonica]
MLDIDQPLVSERDAKVLQQRFSGIFKSMHSHTKRICSASGFRRLTLLKRRPYQQIRRGNLCYEIVKGNVEPPGVFINKRKRTGAGRPRRRRSGVLRTRKNICDRF